MSGSGTKLRNDSKVICKSPEEGKMKIPILCIHTETPIRDKMELK
jgi:hypothetical protein